MNNKCALIIPYFGKFPNYFQLFLDSCRYNTKFDFFIFSDDETHYIYPQNVKFFYTTFSEIKERLKKIDNRFLLSYPKKLCDFKVVYGYLFQEYIYRYSYWGYCDVDVIWGDLDSLVFPILAEDKHDKIFNHGHLTIYRNAKYINELFFEEIRTKGNNSVFFKNEMCKFDEENGDSIVKYFRECGFNIYKNQLEADISTNYSKLFLDKYDFDTNSYSTIKKEFLFIFSQGKTLCYYINDNALVCDEYAYIHLQKRPMDIFISQDDKQYVIASNRFYPLNNCLEKLNVEQFKNIRKYFFNLHGFKIRCSNILVKMKRWISF